MDQTAETLEERGPMDDSDTPRDGRGTRPLLEPSDPFDAQLEWAVGSVAERLDIPAATLRSWDRRYGVGPSQRTEGGHRRYTGEDVRRVYVMGQFTARGVPAQAAARVVLAMTAERLRLESIVPDTSSTPWSRSDHSTEVVKAITEAAHALDGAALARLFRAALRDYNLVTAWTDVLSPALRAIGDQWEAGALGVDSEHLASEVLVTELRALIHANRPAEPTIDVVLASADDEQHYLPLLALEAELARNGVGASFLGPRMPNLVLGKLIRDRKPRRVFLWASLSRPADEPLWEAVRGVEHPMVLVLGGPGWPDALPAVAPSVTLERVWDLGGAARVLLS
jgi:MerR family transcriptional regulator, light-induced transcriptional regulator